MLSCLSCIHTGDFDLRESAFCLFIFSIALVSFFLDLRKKKGKMPTIAAKSVPCECSFREIDMSRKLDQDNNPVTNTQRWSRGHKARGQGQEHKKIPLRGQTLSRLRTGMLEAKDQGHKRKCSPKKKVFKNFFQAICKISTLQKKVLSWSKGQGNFRGLEAKDLTFEAKAKDVLEDSTSAHTNPRISCKF